MDFVFLWCLFLELLGAYTVVKFLVHVYYMYEMKQRREAKRRRMERGF